MTVLKFVKSRLFAPRESAQIATTYGSDLSAQLVALLGAVGLNAELKAAPGYAPEGAFGHRFFDVLVSAIVLAVALYWVFPWFLSWFLKRFGGNVGYSAARRLYGHSAWIPLAVASPIFIGALLYTHGLPGDYGIGLLLVRSIGTIGLIWGFTGLLVSVAAVTGFSDGRSFLVLLLSSLSFLPIPVALMALEQFLRFKG